MYFRFQLNVLCLVWDWTGCVIVVRTVLSRGVTVESAGPAIAACRAMHYSYHVRIHLVDVRLEQRLDALALQLEGGCDKTRLGRPRFGRQRQA